MGAAMRVMIDSNILDRIDVDKEAQDELINRRDILLMITAAQDREVAAIPDTVKRERLQDLMVQLCRRLALSPLSTRVLVPVPVVPIPAQATGVQTGENPSDQFLVGKADTADDTIIAAAFAARCDLLVSEDIEVLNKALAAGIRAMDWRLFLERVVWVPRRRQK